MSVVRSARSANHRSAVLTSIVCALLLAVYAVLASVAVAGKSPTYDEPLHVLAAWLQIHRADFRVDAENPPLWKYFAGLPNSRDSFVPPPSEQRVRNAAESFFTAP